MRFNARGRRYAQKERHAVKACLAEGTDEHLTVRAAAKQFGIKSSTLFDAISRARNLNVKQHTPGRRCALTLREEQVILDTLLKYADHGVPLNRTHLREAISLFVSSLPKERKCNLPFKNAVPGYWYLRGFEKRHVYKIKFGRPLRQESKRHLVVSADTLTTHFAVFEKLISQHSIDASRLWNLDETEYTPGKDSAG